jgi:phosphatidylglycerophosphate synthase
MCHPWLAAGVVCFVGILLYRELAPLAGRHDATAPRGETGLLGAQLRIWFRGRVTPLATMLLAHGLTANGVTFSQLAASVASGLAYAHGWMFTGGWLLIAGGTLDVLDGEMARRGGDAGPRGAFIDSVVDRYGESAVFTGLAVFYRDGSMLWVVLMAWLGGYLVSYARARAEGLGIECREGLLQRPERYVILGLSSMASTVIGQFACGAPARHDLLMLAIAALAVLSHLTAMQRMIATLRKLS